MSALDDLTQLLGQLKGYQEERSEFKAVLSEIVVGVSDIVACMEKRDDSGVANALLALAQGLTSGLQSLSIKAPDIHVNVASAPPPDVNVMVQPAQVVVMPSPSNLNGLKIRITARDGNGSMSEFTFIQPEN